MLKQVFVELCVNNGLYDDAEINDLWSAYVSKDMDLMDVLQYLDTNKEVK